MKNILLIDDDVMEEKLMHIFLTRRYDTDFGLTYVDNIKDGIDLLQSRSFDVVFVDSYLPPYNGAHETYPIVSAHVGDANLIYISSGFDTAGRMSAVDAANFHFVDKLEIKDRIMEGLLEA
ncbi:response regulator receiver domain-containing protein [Hoeflea halophila]|uniref:Response regulator receiver domain-containing protein n=1 Tax=Hoeflea halophila TaxID=714899 RepID=A0A286HMV5_9HYPH|nr:response regulator [Hoeflea halophila]SOE08816.1 response regulator receiver domain-containing protein [Hoeflea halophila]